MGKRMYVSAFAVSLLGLQPVLAGAAESRTASAAVAPTPSESYAVGPGDVLSVFVWRNPDLSVTVPVRPDGRITTPLVEDLSVAGKSTVQIAREIEAALAEYVKSPQVNVIVSTAASVLSQIKVLGQVRNPRAITYIDGMTVLDAMLLVGGLNEFAAGNKAKIVRNERGKSIDLPVKIKDIQDGNLKTNHALRPGDILIVPQSLF
jgi:polysaccharide biosynthesis/export protein